MIVIFQVFALLILLAFGFILWSFVYTSFRGSPFVTIKEKRYKGILQFVKKGDKIADLGCGDGRILIEAVKKGAVKAVGWELDAFVWLQAKYKIARSGVDTSKIEVKYGDFWNADLSEFDVVYVYQMTKYLGPFKEKLLPQLKKDSLIISPDYEIPQMKYWKKVDDKSRGIYIYKV